MIPAVGVAPAVPESGRQLGTLCFYCT